MQRLFTLLFIIIISAPLVADNSQIIEAIKRVDFLQAEFLLANENVSEDNLEIWRQLGYSYKFNDEMAKAIACYEKIFSFDKEDYDAQLALARLYFFSQQYDLSQKYFELILANDLTDVEAYLGLARLEKAKDNFSESVAFYNLSLKYLPKHLPTLFELAETYIYSDQLDEAIKTYNAVLKIDDSWSEAWSGIGKIYWWQDKPFLAIQNYKKAIQLDPGNDEIIQEFKNIKNSTNWIVSVKYSGQTEIEEGYETTSFNQKYALSKLITDNFSLNANSFWQYAQKDENDFITEKYFDSSYLKSNYKIFKNNEINFTLGGSISDSTLTLIDGGWKFQTNWKKINITNNINFGNEYFYHWKKVRKNYLNEKINIKYKKFNFSSAYQFGKVEKNWIWNEYTQRENKFLNYNFALNYQVWNLPIIKIGSSYRFMDYQYNSSLYYSPTDRKIFGLTGSLYYSYKRSYIYLGGSANLDNYDEFETNFDSELGMDYHKFSFSLSFSNFKNNYYESRAFSLIIGGNF